MRSIAIMLAMLALRAHAQDRGPIGVLHERAAAVINPLGGEHMIAVAARMPIGDPSELLFTDAHAEIGLVDYTSPIYSVNGAYLEVSPLAFLVLRAELSAIAMWSIGLPGAGFYPLQSYDADLRALPQHGSEAFGLDVQLSAILQGAIPIGPTRLLMWCQGLLEHERLGEEPFHYSPRHSLVLARSEWMLALSSMALLEIAPSADTRVRFGAYDELRYVTGSDRIAHHAGAIAALSLLHVDPAVSEILIFARAGAYTDHPLLAGEVTGLAGVIVHYDLGPIR